MPATVADLFGLPPDGTITALAPSPRRPDRIAIRVEGKAWATVPREVLEELALAVGQPMDEALAARVAAALARDKAYRQALARLNRRGMSRRQLETKLRQLGCEAPTCAAVLDRLEARGLLNDEALGRQLLHEWQARRPAGPALLRAKLAQRGLARELAERLLAEQAGQTPHDAVADAAQLAARKLRSLRGLDVLMQKRRLWGLLARRGYEPDTVQEAVKRAMDAAKEDD